MTQGLKTFLASSNGSRNGENVIQDSKGKKMKMFLCSILLLTDDRIILMNDRNTAFCNVIIKTNQFDNSFSEGGKIPLHNIYKSHKKSNSRNFQTGKMLRGYVSESN